MKLEKWLLKYHQDSGSSSNIRKDLGDEEYLEEGHVRVPAPIDAE